MKHFIYNTAPEYLARTFDDSVAQTCAVIHGGESTAATSLMIEILIQAVSRFLLRFLFPDSEVAV